MIRSRERVAVVGHPVSHSLSPAIHNAAFAAAGLDWEMVAEDVAPEDGPGLVAAARGRGLRGLPEIFKISVNNFFASSSLSFFTRVVQIRFYNASGPHPLGGSAP